MNDNTHLVELFSGTHWEAEMLKDLLLIDGIESYINNEITGTLMPWITAPGELGDVQVMITSDNIDKAQTTLSFFHANRAE